MKNGLYIPQNDEKFGARYIDVEEKRSRVSQNGKTLDYVYVHGGFENTGVKFSLCMPDKPLSAARIFHYLNPSPSCDEELRGLSLTGEADQISFCLLHDSCFLESNMGSTSSFSPSSDPQLCWKASAQVMLFAKDIVKEKYSVEKVYGYVHGGSGGGYKTMACIENTDGVFDGALPYVIGSPVSLPNTIVMHALGQRVLRRSFGKILSAIDAGGSGNPYENLDPVESAVLKELTFMGIPQKAWFLEAKGVFTDGALPVIAPVVKMADPTYFDDFWNKEGYEGFDDVYNAKADRILLETTVKRVHLPDENIEKSSSYGVDSAWQDSLAAVRNAYIELNSFREGDDLYLEGLTLSVLSGEAAGKTIPVGKALLPCGENGAKLFIGMTPDIAGVLSALSAIKAGDSVKIDNSDYIAVQYYYRHQVPEDLSFKAWDLFRKENGEPSLPQRAFVMGYSFSGTGTIQNGNVHCKTINLQSLTDEATCPWCADWYRQKVAENGKLDIYRTYLSENAMHGDYDCPQTNFNVSYTGAMRQLLLDLAEWVEKGVEPLPSSSYTMTDNVPRLPEKLSDRKGIQPALSFTVNGKDRAELKAGETAVFGIETFVPEGAGSITRICVDFFDRDPSVLRPEFETDVPFDEKGNATFEKTFENAGEFFVSAIVFSQRTGDKQNVYTQIKNLARVKVIVK